MLGLLGVSCIEGAARPVTTPGLLLATPLARVTPQVPYPMARPTRRRVRPSSPFRGPTGAATAPVGHVPAARGGALGAGPGPVAPPHRGPAPLRASGGRGRISFACLAVAFGVGLTVALRRRGSTRQLGPVGLVVMSATLDESGTEPGQAVWRRGQVMPKGCAYTELPYEGYLDETRPAALWKLAASNFKRQGATILTQVAETVGLRQRDPLCPPACLGLTLSNEAVKEAERRREEKGGRVDANPVSRALYDVGCLLLDNLFDERPIQRFWFLETIARIPYFSYVSMLHLYESFGWWRACELRKVHHSLKYMHQLGLGRVGCGWVATPPCATPQGPCLLLDLSPLLPRLPSAGSYFLPGLALFAHGGSVL